MTARSFDDERLDDCSSDQSVLVLSRGATVLDFDERVGWFENGSPR